MPFAALDANVERCLPGYSRDVACEGAIVHYAREEVTSGSVRYLISAREPGDLGNVLIYQIGPETCNMLIEGPKRPRGRLPSDEEMASIRGIGDKKQYKSELRRLMQAIRLENETIYQERRRVQDRIVGSFLKRFQRDVVTRMTEAPPPSIKGKPGRDEEQQQEAWSSIGNKRRRERRYQVQLFRGAGYTIKQIAENTGWGKRTVVRDLAWLREHKLL